MKVIAETPTEIAELIADMLGILFGPDELVALRRGLRQRRREVLASLDQFYNPPADRRCPICEAPGRVDAPELGMLQATCVACGWHFDANESEATR